MKFFLYLSLSVVAWTLLADEEVPGDGAAWNAGVDAYLSGDATNALRTLKPLLSSKTHAARAAEVVAKLEYDAAHDLGASNTLQHLEAAASAAQIALRANPADARANANFTRATEGLAELRETTRVNDLIAAAEGKDPAAVLGEAMKEARALIKEAKSAAKLDAAGRIEKADAMEDRARKLADVWIPLKDAVAKNMTNESAAAEATARMDEALALSRDAAKKLGDLERGGEDAIAASEDVFNSFYKSVVMPPEAMAENLASQSNAWSGAEQIGARSWQADAVGYTKAFRSRLGQWAEQYRQQAQADTNKPPFTVEMENKVSDLAEKLESLQVACCQEPDKAKSKEALDIIGQILGLLPKPPQNQQQQNQQQQNKQDKQNQKQDSQQGGEDNKDDKQDGEQQQDEQSSSGEDKQDEQKQEQQAEAKPDERSQEEKEDDAMLRRVLERSAEHEAEKRARSGQRRAVKDW